VSPPVFIKDRSISPVENQRKESVSYIESVVKQLGCTAEIQEWQRTTKIKKGPYSGEDFTFTYRNVIVTVPGTLPKEQQKIIVIGAHHDTQNSWSSCWHGAQGDYQATVGADDNTSGVVGCLVLLKKLKNKPLQHTLKVVLFDGEEPGIANPMAAGSKYYVDSLSKSDISNTKLALIIDMIGGPPTTPGIGLVISASRNCDIFSLIETVSNVPGTIPVTFANHEMNIDLSCLTLSDSVRFNSVEIPTLLLCNVAGYSDVPDFYHTEKDTMAVLDWPTFFRAVGVGQAIVEDSCKHKG